MFVKPNIQPNDTIEPELKIGGNTTLATNPGVLMVVGGGLGNQLFRYACAYSLAKRLNISLYLPSKEKKSVLEHFSIRNLSIASTPKILDSELIEPSQIHNINEEDILWKWDSLPNNTVLSYPGFCQSEEYFREYKQEILDHFEQSITAADLENEVMQRWTKEIEHSANNSIAVHIRRGDYVNYGMSTPIAFYIKAIGMMERLFSGENLTFYIFSDSLELVREELGNSTVKGLPWEKMKFVSISKEMSNVQEFKLMRRCGHIIMSNSTFSWWVAYLIQNKGKIVIAPAFSEDIVKKFPQFTKFKNFKSLLYNSLFFLKEWTVISEN